MRGTKWLAGAGALAVMAALPAVVVGQLPTVLVLAAPASSSVPLGRSASLATVWTVKTTLKVLVTISSPPGVFRASATGPVLGTVGQPLARSGVLGGATFGETVLVPADVVVRAQKLGLARFEYARTFSDGTSTSEGVVFLDVTSPAGAGFGVSRLALRFDDGSPVRVVSVGEPLRVLADVTFTGSGLLQAAWELAEPPSTLGTPVFQSLRVVREHLVAGDRATLASPDLPTRQTGLYLVRLRVTDPALPFESPVIRYFVGEPGPGEVAGAPGAAPAALDLEGPPHLARLEPGTRFAWRPVAGARAYQLELYARPTEPGPAVPRAPGGLLEGRLDRLVIAAAPLAGPPVTGMVVPGTQTETGLSQPARERLRGGDAYVWRVLAIGPDGTVLAESALREVRLP